MQVLFIGTGNVGATLARRFKALGHAVQLYNESQTLPEGFETETLATDLSAAVATAEMVVFATPFAAIQTIASSVKDWSNTIVIDATNPIANGLKHLSVGNTNSGAETVSKWIPDAKVVKAFNTTGWENMADSDYGNNKLAMFLAGDDMESKQTVSQIIEAMGFDAFDAGELFMSRFLEAMAMVWIRPARLENQGADFGFSIIRR